MGFFCPPCDRGIETALSVARRHHGIGTSWLRLVAVVPGAVWYATGYLHSLYTAAEHSISPLQQQATACPWHPAAATDERIERLPVMLQAVARCGWFISCLGLSDMPIPTPIAYFPPQSTRFWRFSGFFCPPWTAASKRLSQSPGRHGIGTSWLQLVAVVPGAV